MARFPSPSLWRWRQSARVLGASNVRASGLGRLAPASHIAFTALLLLDTCLLVLVSATGAQAEFVDRLPRTVTHALRPNSGAAFLTAVGLLIATVLAYWWPRRRRSHHLTAVTGVILTAAVISLAVPGYGRCEGGQTPFWTSLTWTLSLFLGSVQEPFGTHCVGTMPLSVQLARLAAISTTFIGIAAVVGSALGVQFDRVRAQLSPSVIAVFGLDESVVPFVEVLVRNRPLGTVVTVVQADPAHPLIGRVRSIGAHSVISDATDVQAVGRLLRRRRLRGGFNALLAAYVLSPSAEEAIAIARAVKTVADDVARPDGSMPRLVLRLDDPWRANDWRRRQIGDEATILVDTLGLNSVTAQGLVDEVLAVDVTHLVITGTSDLALAILDELVQHLRERKPGFDDPLRVWLLAPEASKLLADHTLNQTHFSQQVSPLTIIALDEESTPERLGELFEGATTPVVLSASLPSSTTIREAERLARRTRRALFLVWDDDVQGVSDDLTYGNVREFGRTLLAKHPKTSMNAIPEDGWERIARRLHEDYLANSESPGAPTKYSQREWHELSAFYQHSGVRRVAVALSIAVQAGRSWVPPSGGEVTPVPVTMAEIKSLAHLEHESWRQYYLAHGWRAGPRRERLGHALQHPDLVPWSELDVASGAHHYTAQSVADCLAYLASLGYVPFAATYRRKGEVTARQRLESWSWHTDSGEVMHASAGDWEVSDGERRPWSVRDVDFKRTYAHVEGSTYRRVGEVTARPAMPGEVVISTEGSATALAGEWVVTDMEGHAWLVSTALLEGSYERTATH